MSFGIFSAHLRGPSAIVVGIGTSEATLQGSHFSSREGSLDIEFELCRFKITNYVTLDFSNFAKIMTRENWQFP